MESEAVMKEHSADRAIHEKMGKSNELPYRSECNCECHVHRYGPSFSHGRKVGCCQPDPPDYSKDLRPVFEWMRGKGKYGLSRWRDFTNFLNKKEIDYLFEFHDKSCSEQRDLIAQWIESTRESSSD
jgi:hypothetical protein